ncbi:MAG: HlyD family type I secretion periplasmic adaptor subunit [Anaeromusa sp.]|uniref:HlyD family type I secretion periplasmic adaptor subunit n=1 Tax=Anaeromusa sp. TaxID=1872520 RepID=UPI002B216E5E|nr:HlyD family type I secretion periplasmic adaptor subunit [Anaeromusa sp.]MEA4836637.1 HlyD family type I secretion periplasmic adaptor subunit [Anaeromusa sp.]
MMFFDKIKQKLAARLNAKEKEFLPAILEVTETPASPVGRMVLYALFLAVGIAVCWSIFGYVDEVAVAPGKIIPIGQVKTIQSEDKGVVRQIYVKEGQKVKKGEVLIELDPTTTEADLFTIRKEIAYYTLEMERLQAELQGGGFSPSAKTELDPKDLAFQLQLYQTRMSEYQAKKMAAQMAVNQQESAVRSAQAQAVKYQELLVIAKDQEARVEQLLADNAIALFQAMTYRSNRIQMENNLSSQQSEVVRAEAALAQSLQQLAGVTAEHERDIAAKLVEDRRQLANYAEQLKKAEEKNRLSRIVAPVDGRVGQLAIHTVGGIVTEAQALMIIVPEDVTVEVEAWAANKDIGFIHEGQEAEVKIETFNFQKYGTVKAHVRDVSPDAMEDKEKGRVYRVLLTLDKDSLLVNDSFTNLTVGMTATADIKIREKRVIEYFLDPFRKYKNEALRER